MEQYTAKSPGKPCLKLVPQAGGQPCAKSFFTATLGTPLSMQQLRMQAFPDGQRRPAPAAPVWDDDSEPGGGGADSDFNPDESQWLGYDASFGAAATSGERPVLISTGGLRPE